MDTSATADNLNEPLLVASDENDNEEEFYDASSNLSSSNTNTNNNLVATSSATSTSTSSSATSYYGKVSPLSTGLLFPSSHGVVDRLPSSSSSSNTSIPCLLFADHDPLAAISHICLLEKEVDYQGGVLAPSTLQRLTPQLFSVVHTCQPLCNQNAGMRIIKKINKQYTQENDTLKLPVLIHEGNIYQEGQIDSNETSWSTTLSLLLPEFIDECIGKKHLLRPNDATGLYNMNLVSILEYTSLLCYAYLTHILTL